MLGVVCDAAGYGENILRLTVTDALGDTASSEATIVSSSNDTNSGMPLPILNDSMTAAEKVVLVARSQLGYREMDENFIIREDGSVQGWSYFGSCFGMPFDEWCAYFANFCLDKAGIDRQQFLRDGNCNRWTQMLGEDYVDDEDDYIPTPGDIIFFHHSRVSDDPNYPNHVGIVLDYDEATQTVQTIEGNSGKSVRTRQYNHSDAGIIGYASMRDWMLQWDEVYRAAHPEAVKEADDKANIERLFRARSY